MKDICQFIPPEANRRDIEYHNFVYEAELDRLEHSLLAAIGSAIAWIFYPLGWVGDMAWKATVATFTGLMNSDAVKLFLEK